MRSRWLIVAFVAGSLAGATGFRAAVPSTVADGAAPQPPAEFQVVQLLAQPAEAHREVERLRAELARRDAAPPPAGEEEAQRPALTVARASYRALADGDGRALALLHPDPIAIDLHVPTADGSIRHATPAHADALAVLAAWVRNRRPEHEPAGQHFADLHAPDGGGFDNVLLKLAGGYLFVQPDGDGHVVEVAGMTEAPGLD